MISVLYYISGTELTIKSLSRESLMNHIFVENLLPLNRTFRISSKLFSNKQTRVIKVNN